MGSPVKSSQSFPITDDQGNALHSPATVAEKFRAFYSSHGSQIPAADERDVEFSFAIEDAIAYENPNFYVAEVDFSLSNLHSIAIGSGFSTTDHLLRLESLVKRGFNSSSNSYGIFLDLTKAYDLTWINGLLFKLSCLKISGSILLWFKNFILNRNLCVRLSSSVPFWGVSHKEDKIVA